MASNLGLKVKYITKPWNELVEDFKRGKIDLIHTIYKTPKREEFMSFSMPYLIGDIYFITRDNWDKVNSFSDFEGKRFGISKIGLMKIF